jgi:hypothetical protein
LALGLRAPDDTHDQIWALLDRVVPGLDARELADNKAKALRSLDTVADRVSAQLSPKHRKPLAREEFSPGKSPRESLRRACARVTVETLCALTTDDLIAQTLRRQLIATIAGRVRGEIQAAEVERRRYRGASAEWQLDHAVRTAQEMGRLAKTSPEQEVLTISIEQEDDARAAEETRETERLAEGEVRRLIGKFLKVRKYRKHRDGMRLLLSDTRGQGATLARQRGITESAVTYRRQQALRDFLRWVHQELGAPASS